MKKISKTIVFSVWIFTCAAFGYFLPKIPIFKNLVEIKVVKVIGFNKVKKQEIENLFSGENWFFLNENRIKEILLKKYHQIKDVRIKRPFLGGVYLYIIPRKPVALVYYHGQKYLTDKDGFFFKDNVKSKLPKIYIYDKIDNRQDNLIADILKTKNKLNSYVKVKKVIIKKKLVSFFSRDGRIIIFSTENLKKQLKKLDKFAEKVDISHYKYLNFTFDSMVVARR